jgi:hypothetical protein
MILLEMLRSSFRLIGVLHEGQGPNADDIADSLVVLNSMLEAWSLERLNVFTVQPATVTLDAGQQVYQIGTGSPDFNIPRPVRIESANVLTAATGGPFELPLEILNLQQWTGIGIKSTPSTLPTRLYYDNQFPWGNLYFWPTPSVDVQVILWMWQALQTGFTNTSVTLAFPPGYADAIRYNLACKLAPEWDRPIRPDVLEMAVQSKAAIKRMNKPTLYLGTDAGLAPRGGGAAWNWLTGN